MYRLAPFYPAECINLNQLITQILAPEK